jgi:hypothetical protein
VFTTILAYVIALLGLAMIGGGIWGIVYLVGQPQTPRIPLRYYGMAIGMICGGVGMVGVAQALRILLSLVAGVNGLHGLQ